MQRSSVVANALCTKMLTPHNRSKIHSIISSGSWDVFINHRGIDTKRNVAGMLYEHLSRIGLRPFLDSKCMEPGDNLTKKIDTAIGDCKVAIAVFSPRYCESYHCLHELALILKSNKIMIPIFCNIKPSQLQVPDDGSNLAKRLQRYTRAVQVAKHTVGLSFDSSKGDWSELLSKASEAVMKSMLDEEGRSVLMNQKA